MINLHQETYPRRRHPAVTKETLQVQRPHQENDSGQMSGRKDWVRKSLSQTPSCEWDKEVTKLFYCGEK